MATSTFMCKICGGSLEIAANQSTAVCQYCGVAQTLPRLPDERRVQLYARAGHFRRSDEFDKAMGIYETILAEDNTDAEAYWSLVLCRFGVEYVEDPATGKRMPTINRTQYTSIFDDEDYKSALRYADMAQRRIYEAEAAAINDIQKGILAISQKEEPFDVFICYKETDPNGRRTPDSVLAAELYHELIREGFKVFFSRITLEDKLGTAYEPYIFAALNSAKVMVVLGTKPEYFNAVWVKNEWSRYLVLVKQSEGKKMLIPAYRGMDPYNLPDEFSHLQAQDMSKLGFMQDLVRGIRKIVTAGAPKAAPVQETIIVDHGGREIEPLAKRAFMFLEDGEWDNAAEYFDKILDMNPEYAPAYLGLLMHTFRVRRREHLRNCEQPFDQNKYYRKIMAFGDDAIKREMTECIAYINKRNEEAVLVATYIRATDHMQAATDVDDFNETAELFESLGDFRDAPAQAKICREKAAAAARVVMYHTAEKTEKIAERRMSQGEYAAAAENIDQALRMYQNAAQGEPIPEIADVDACIERCTLMLRDMPHIQTFDRANSMERAADKYIQISRFSEAEKMYDRAIEIFRLVEGFKREEAEGEIALCEKKKQNIPTARAYQDARALEGTGCNTQRPVAERLQALHKAAETYASISGWRDAVARAESCRAMISSLQFAEQTRREQEAVAKRAARRKRIITLSVIGAIALLVAFIIVLTTVIIPAVNLANWRALYGEDIVVSTRNDMPHLKIDDGAISLSETDDPPSQLVIPQVLDNQLVTRIESYGFAKNGRITSVTIPRSVESIGSYAFDRCHALKTVVISEGVTSVGSTAFRGCTSLQQVTMPVTLDAISDYMFYGCSALSTVVIPEGVSRIGREAFTGCENLTTMRIPASVRHIGNYAFDGCTNLTTIYFGGTRDGFHALYENMASNGYPTARTVHCSDGTMVLY